MADIFISYSRKDSREADELVSRLKEAGISVWIDKHGIIGAEEWATEIVEGIHACSTFLLLLSTNSVQSENVLKELSLANETRKRILPVDIHPTELPTSFMYPLAGLQRVALSEFDAILRAHKHGVGRTVAKDTRKTLMILPFDDLSAAQDSEWLANGIVSELIGALSNVRSLRLADIQATKGFRKYTGLLTTYAAEMNIRYFVPGDVRKMGDRIKISARLLDIQTGDFLWQESMKGVMDDIFDIQEQVAEKVVEGLKLHLDSDERKKLAERGTENAEAYELALKAQAFFDRQTKEGFEHAIQLYSDATLLDPMYARVYQAKATALATLYRNYTPDPALLEEGSRLINETLRLKPDLWGAYGPRTFILQLQGKLEEAEESAKEYVAMAPDDWGSHFTLGFFYENIHEPEKAIPAYEASLKLRPEYLTSLWNLAGCAFNAGDKQKMRHWAEISLPIFEKHLKLFPDDEWNRVNRAALLYFAGKSSEAEEAARKLENLRDGYSLFNAACLQSELKEYDAALKTLRKSIQAGFRNLSLLRGYLLGDDSEFVKLKGTPAYELLREEHEALSALIENLAADLAMEQQEKSNG